MNWSVFPPGSKVNLNIGSGKVACWIENDDGVYVLAESDMALHCLAGSALGEPRAPMFPWLDRQEEEEAKSEPADAPASPPAASAVELAPGQVWEDSYGSARVEIYHIDRQPHPKHGPAINYKLVSSPNVTGSRYPDSFRKAFPNLISPGLASPEPATPPNPPPSPVALLAAGRRCRFVRDAGPIGEAFPAAVEAFVWWEFDGHTHRGVVIEDSEDTPHVFCTPQHSGGVAAATRLASLLSSLGYRFAGPADAEAEAS